MMILDPVTALLFTLFSLSCAIWVRVWVKRNRVPLPPGPLGLPIIGNLLSLEPNLHSYFHKLALSYGPLLSLRLGSKLCVIISSPALAKEVLKDHDLTFANRDVLSVARISSYGYSDIAWSPYGPQWRLLRKIVVQKMLSTTSLDAVYTIRRHEIRRTVKFLYRRAGQPVNFGEQIVLTMWNVMRNMMWGGGGTVKEEEEIESLGREHRQALLEITSLLGTPNVSDFFPILARFDLQGIEKKMKVCVKKFDGIFEREIDLRLKLKMNQGEKKEKDFLDVLLQYKDYYEEDNVDSDKKVEFSMTHLKALLMDMVLGGADTYSNLMEFIMVEILNKPMVLEKIQKELDTVVGYNSTVEEHHIHSLPYLKAVIKETLRIHPILPLLVPHCPSKSCIIGSYTIPKGSRVFINAWAIHRDPLLWANPLEFDPERFINAKFDFTGNDFSYLPFGSGRRICVAIAMTDRMMLFSMATLLHSFNWRLPQGEKMDLEEKLGLTLRKKVSLTIIPEPRLHDPALYE